MNALVPACATLGLVLSGCTAAPAHAPATQVARPTAAPIPIEVLKPEGEGPFAAVVPMHDCSGLGPRGGASPRRWARKRRGATTEGNAEAWADSLREVRAFFDAHLER